MGSHRRVKTNLLTRMRGAVQSHLLRSRTRVTYNTALRHLDCLAVALEASGWQCSRLYRPNALPLAAPLLRVRTPGAEDVEIWIRVRVEPYGHWAYYEAHRGCRRLHSCGDAKGAAASIANVLRQRLSSSP